MDRETPVPQGEQASVIAEACAVQLLIFGVGISIGVQDGSVPRASAKDRSDRCINLPV